MLHLDSRGTDQSFVASFRSIARGSDYPGSFAIDHITNKVT